MLHPVLIEDLMQSPPEPSLVVCYGGEYRIETGVGVYAFEMARCLTPSDLLAWVHHLSGKAWFTTRHARQLIKTARDNGVPIHFDC